MKAPGNERLKLKYEELLSNVAFKFNLRRYNKDQRAAQRSVRGDKIDKHDLVGRGLHWFTSQLNLSRFGYTFPCPYV